MHFPDLNIEVIETATSHLDAADAMREDELAPTHSAKRPDLVGWLVW
jgi:hypothetical protein